MFGSKPGVDQAVAEVVAPISTPATSDTSRAAATETVSAAETNPYASPGVPPLPGEDSTVDFRAAFEVVIEVDPGARIADPLAGLDAKEREAYRGELEDVINAQRYGRSLGSVSRHSR
jgi:hypothetical protein